MKCKQEFEVILVLFGIIFMCVLAEPLIEEEDAFPLDDDMAAEQIDLEMEDDLEGRRGKFFSFYGFPKLESVLPLGKANARCIRDSGDRVRERHGVCAGKTQCRKMLGTDTERSCDSKFGYSCCLLNVTCNRSKETITVKKDLVYLRHEENQQECLTNYKFPRQTNICQLRLEFKQFDLASPTSSGECLADKMTIRKADNLRNNLVLCGKANETDHLYLHYGESNEIVINLDVAQRPDFGEVEILVRQIKCNSPEMAPEGCTQYFTQQRGDVRSFNFDRVTGQHLNNQIYSVCIKGTEGSNSVMWTPCRGPEDFHIINGPAVPNCPTDSITIPGSPLSKYCAPASFMAETEARPYVLYVHLDANEVMPIPPASAPTAPCPLPWVPDEAPNQDQCVYPAGAAAADDSNRGFCLRYQLG